METTIEDQNKAHVFKYTCEQIQDGAKDFPTLSLYFVTELFISCCQAFTIPDPFTENLLSTLWLEVNTTWESKILLLCKTRVLELSEVRGTNLENMPLNLLSRQNVLKLFKLSVINDQ